jgi:hypothetical protein
MNFLLMKEEIDATAFFFLLPNIFMNIKIGRMVNKTKKAIIASRRKEREKMNQFLGSVGIVKIKIPQKIDIRDIRMQSILATIRTKKGELVRDLIFTNRLESIFGSFFYYSQLFFH